MKESTSKALVYVMTLALIVCYFISAIGYFSPDYHFISMFALTYGGMNMSANPIFFIFVLIPLFIFLRNYYIKGKVRVANLTLLSSLGLIACCSFYIFIERNLNGMVLLYGPGIVLSSLLYLLIILVALLSEDEERKVLHPIEKQDIKESFSKCLKG